VKGINREHGEDDPKRDRDRGCPRNCKRIAVHPRDADMRHATVFDRRKLNDTGRQMEATIRKPGDLPS